MKRLVLLLVSLVIAGGAFAQQAPAKKEATPARQMQGPCAEDTAKFCKDVQRGGGRIIACLQGQSDKLSPACKDQVTKAQERRAERKAESQKKAPAAASEAARKAPAPAAPEPTKK